MPAIPFHGAYCGTKKRCWFLIQTIGFYLYLFISLFHMTCKFWRYKELVWYAYTKQSMSVKMKLFDNVFNIIGSAFILNIFKHVLNLEILFRLFLRMSNAFFPVARFSKLPYHLNVCSLYIVDLWICAVTAYGCPGSFNMTF